MDLCIFLKYTKFSIEWWSHWAFDKVNIILKYFFTSTIETYFAAFEKFLITTDYGRSDFGTFSQQKKMTSNGCKPIRLLINVIWYLFQIYLYPGLQHTRFLMIFKKF